MKMSFPVVLVLACALQVYSRYAAAPVVDFTVDDWALLARAQNLPTYTDAAAIVAQDIDRPFGASALMLLFKLFDDRPWCWALFSIGAYSVLMALILMLARRLDARPSFGLLVGAIFALVPNMTESFLWPTMVAYVGSTIGYVACAFFWVVYLERGRMYAAVLSGLALLFALGTYEVGIGIPFALLALMDRRRWRSQWVGWLPCAAAICLYVAWKMTHGFGLAPGFLTPPRQVNISPGVALLNAKDTVSWWVGGKMFACIESGWSAFMTLAKWPWRFFYAGNLVVAATLALALPSLLKGDAESDEAGTKFFTAQQVILFGLAWAVVSAGISLLAWTGGRLNIVPAIGIAIVLARVLCDRPQGAWVPVFAIVTLLFLPANQGTAVAWRDSGTFHRNLYNYLCRHEPDWRNAEVVLFDTALLRQRLTRGLLPPPNESITSWAYYQNAGLLRGFAPAAMMNMAATSPRRPIPVLDTECGATWNHDELAWHDRWNESVPHRTPTSRVFLVDCFEAGSGPP